MRNCEKCGRRHNGPDARYVLTDKGLDVLAHIRMLRSTRGGSESTEGVRGSPTPRVLRGIHDGADFGNDTSSFRPRIRFHVLPRRIRYSRGEARVLLTRASDVTGKPLDDILAPTRRRDVARIRHAVMFVLRERGWTFRAIGDELGRLGPDTVAYGVSVCSSRLETDKATRALVTALREVL